MMRFIARLVAAVLLPLLLTSCDKTPVPPMVFGAGAWPGYAPVFLARDQGYFAASNLRLDEYTNAAELRKAFREHVLHMAAVSLEDALQLRRDVPDLKIVLLFDASNGADAILAQPGITSMRQLEGRRVLQENDAQGAHFLSLALKEAGMQAGQVEVITLPADRQLAAFQAHTADAVVACEPVRTRLLEAGAQIVFDSSRVPGKILDVLVTHDEDIGKYHREMVELVRGWQRALEDIRTAPDKAMQAMAARGKMPPAQMGKALQGIELLGIQRNRELLLGDPSPVGASVDAVQRFLLERGLINVGADTATLLDATLLSEAAR